MDNGKVTPPRELAIQAIQSAITNLTNAHSTLVQANGMAADVPAVQRLVSIGKELVPVMQEVSKLRGL